MHLNLWCTLLNVFFTNKLYVYIEAVNSRIVENIQKVRSSSDQIGGCNFYIKKPENTLKIPDAHFLANCWKLSLENFFTILNLKRVFNFWLWLHSFSIKTSKFWSSILVIPYINIWVSMFLILFLNLSLGWRVWTNSRRRQLWNLWKMWNRNITFRTGFS